MSKDEEHEQAAVTGAAALLFSFTRTFAWPSFTAPCKSIDLDFLLPAQDRTIVVKEFVEP